MPFSFCFLIFGGGMEEESCLIYNRYLDLLVNRWVGIGQSELEFVT